ncbi:MAG: histidinol-phosphatase [Nitrospinae bacterium]|nr:histidinol-phosphatase [Nitrospinota bacterium]
MKEKTSQQIFEHGAIWLRADFHLHTKEDKEFQYSGAENEFINQYIDKLKEENISLAVITNHNKFAYSEYKAISKTARREEIYALPGVELSVNDGSNGIHTLVVFDPEQWLANGNDLISQFLTSTFSGKINYENANGRSNHSLIQTIDLLNSFQKNYFMIMAHIEQRSGFLEELDGGRISEFAKNPLFRKVVLGFQKLSTRDKLTNLNIWFNNQLPAFVEGSDAKSIDGIGKGEKIFIKIGDYNFDAVKYALMDYKYRVNKEIPPLSQAYIKSISFTSSKQDIKQVCLNPAMNNLIGIRGSGKSSILETLRYALDIDLDDTSDDGDAKYKNGCVANFLGSGGKTRLEIVDHQGSLIVAEKILGDRTNIYVDGNLSPSLKISGLLKKPLYFGQKDLSNIKGSNSIESLINQLIGEKVKNHRQKIEEKNAEVLNFLSDIARQSKSLAQKPDIEAKNAELEHKLKVFKDNEIDKKLNRQIEFDKDANRFRNLKEFEQDVITQLEDFISNYRDTFKSYLGYQSKENADLIEKAYQSFENFTKLFNQLPLLISQMKDESSNLTSIEKQFLGKYEDLKEEFSKIKREINLPNIQADDYVKFNKELENTNFKLKELEKIKDKALQLQKQLIVSLTQLQKLWNDEYNLVSEEIEKINADQSSIKIVMEFKGDKEKFKEFLKDSVRGANIREANIQSLVGSYSDLIEIYRDLNESATSTKVSDILSGGIQFNSFKTRFDENLGTFLTYRVPDYFEIFYKEKPLIEHSLGQRASALIIFILSLKENDIIIIDQPEDDLDNQTIYDDVIRVLRDLKTKTQFIFATHNPNIPVLGDCEQIISCRYENKKISAFVGSIDDISIRKHIVTIMEGGDEAFEKRKMIYELWKQ